jgi:transposase
MYYVGLDIHKAFTVGVIKTKDGEELNKAKFENTEQNFNSFFMDFPPETTEVVIESTYLLEHIHDKLEKRDYKVKLSNQAKTKAIAFAKIKTDSVDASTLADLLRANLVAESYIPTKEVRALRDVVRQRKTLVKGRTQIKNKIHAILIRQGIKLPYKSLCPKAINWLNKNIDINDILISYFNILEQYNNEVKFIENRIEEIAYKNKQARLLMTIPGIGSIRAMEIIAEIADINRFENASKLCSYAGLVPSIRQSGNSLKFGSLIKQASRSLKNALIESSWVAVRSKETNSLKLHYLRLKDKKGKQKAICATARKMLCVIHAMLRKNQEFRA